VLRKLNSTLDWSELNARLDLPDMKAAKVTMVVGALLLVASSLQGCGCDTDKANTCITDVTKKVGSGKTLCDLVKELLGCVKDNSCCDEDGMKKVIDSWKAAPYNCKDIGSC